MKTFEPLYLAEFFLQWEVFQVEVVGEIKVLMFSENPPSSTKIMHFTR
jgi:hypothetical protein